MSPTTPASPPPGRLPRGGRATALVLASLLAGCGDGGPPPGSLEAIRAAGELVVLTRNAPTTYYVGRDGPEGIEYRLTRRVAAALGVKPRYVLLDSVADILEAAEAGAGHIAAAGLTLTEERARRLLFSRPYQRVEQQVVCNRRDAQPGTVADLVGRSLLVIADSSYVERLSALRAQHPELAWEETRDLATEQVLEKVWQREVDCAVADSNIVSVNRRYYPELHIAFALSEEQPLAWVLLPGAEPLKAFVDAELARLEADGTLAALHERFYGHVEIFDYVDTRAYVRRIGKRLPRYRTLFEEAAEAHDLPWTLLAAQAYQESHWNPKARSPTGVRGLMMLTRSLARELGIKNRVDPAQSVQGGARYLSELRERLEGDFRDRDRTWFSLAAYNIGYYHLRDARALAERLGEDPDSWSDMKRVLPLLSQKRYYKTLPYGYARGSEPVHYVRRIRNYEEILRQKLREQSANGSANSP